MKNLNECKEYYKDLYMNCLAVDGFNKNKFNCTELAQFEAHKNTLAFIYGEEFDNIERIWQKETLKEFYSK